MVGETNPVVFASEAMVLKSKPLVWETNAMVSKPETIFRLTAKMAFVIKKAVSVT
jgi:hypothetical protein